MSLEKLTHHGHLHMHPLQFALHDTWNQLSNPPLQPIPITPEVQSALEWWSDQPNLTSGVPLHQPPPQLQLFTDASTEGWGAHLDLQQVAGRWTPEQQHLHINILELLAVCLALQHFQQRVANRSDRQLHSGCPDPQPGWDSPKTTQPPKLHYCYHGPTITASS